MLPVQYSRVHKAGPGLAGVFLLSVVREEFLGLKLDTGRQTDRYRYPAGDVRDKRTD